MADLPRLSLRAASADDAELLHGWRNDLQTRAASRNSHVVDAGEHGCWLQRTLGDPERHLLIAELEDEPIGQVRFEPRAGDAHEISVTLAPPSRGKGLGTPLIEAGVAWLRRERGAVRVIAEVRSGNESSLRAFRKAGFRRSRAPGSEGFERLEFSQPAG